MIANKCVLQTLIQVSRQNSQEQRATFQREGSLELEPVQSTFPGGLVISIRMDMMVIKEMMDMMDMVNMEDMMETMDKMVITKVRLDLQGQGRLGGSAVQRSICKPEEKSFQYFLKYPGTVVHALNIFSGK